MPEASSKNMKLISRNTLTGFGGIGEGMSMQLAKGGRRIMWLAHEGAPKNFTGVDVTDVKTQRLSARPNSRTNKCAPTHWKSAAILWL